MKAISFFLVLATCLTGPIILKAQSPKAGTMTSHVHWDAPICIRIPGMKNRITWKTAETLQTKYYEVLRSSDGINFKSIGIVSVSSQNSTSYMFEDEQPLTSAYYQICSVSGVGVRYYSPKIKTVSTMDNTLVRQGYNATTLVFNDNSNRVITLVNMNGQHLRKESANGFQYIIPTHTLARGIYVVRIETNGITDVKKIIVL